MLYCCTDAHNYIAKLLQYFQSAKFFWKKLKNFVTLHVNKSIYI